MARKHKIIKRFGPSVLKVKVPKKILNRLNNYIDNISKNKRKFSKLNHGQIAFGKNLDSTFELAQEIENICHQYINALRIGIPKILSKKEMKEVLRKMKNYKKG